MHFSYFFENQSPSQFSTTGILQTRCVFCCFSAESQKAVVRSCSSEKSFRSVQQWESGTVVRSRCRRDCPDARANYTCSDINKLLGKIRDNSWNVQVQIGKVFHCTGLSSWCLSLLFFVGVSSIFLLKVRALHFRSVQNVKAYRIIINYNYNTLWVRIVYTAVALFNICFSLLHICLEVHDDALILVQLNNECAVLLCSK